MPKDTVVQNLFDVSGRRLPPDAPGAPVNPACARYTLVQPAIDYADVHARLSEYTGLGGQVSAAEFADRAQRLLDTLRGDEETAPLVSGVHVPFALAADRQDDLGQAMEDVYLPAL